MKDTFHMITHKKLFLRNCVFYNLTVRDALGNFNY